MGGVKIIFSSENNFKNQTVKSITNNQSLKRLNIEDPLSFNFITESDIIIIHNSKNELITLKNNQNQQKRNNQQTTDLKNIKKLKDGTSVEVEGLVSILPGTFGSQYFYIHDQYENYNEIYGLKIYNYNKLFPDLKINDRVKVRGKLSITSGKITAFKIKTEQIEDIDIISSDNIFPSTTPENIKNFTSEQADNFKTVKGQITQKSGKQIYLDDGEGEILIDLKKGSGLTSKDLELGKIFSISGILAFTSSSSEDIKIIPTKKEDIKELEIATKTVITDNKKSDEKVLETKTIKNKALISYSIIIIITVSVFIIFRKK